MSPIGRIRYANISSFYMGWAAFFRFSRLFTAQRSSRIGIGVLAVIAGTISNLKAQDNSPQPVANTNEAPSTSEGPEVYKRMSLQELMNQDVTSVAREPQPYGQAPAAIDVITGDEIHNSGASSIPEALRLADNLDVAQKSSHDWAIS